MKDTNTRVYTRRAGRGGAGRAARRGTRGGVGNGGECVAAAAACRYRILTLTIILCTCGSEEPPHQCTLSQQAREDGASLRAAGLHQCPGRRASTASQPLRRGGRRQEPARVSWRGVPGQVRADQSGWNRPLLVTVIQELLTLDDDVRLSRQHL